MICVSKEFVNIEAKMRRLAETDWRAYIGTSHELRLVYPLMSMSRLVCYHNVKGLSRGSRFEVDLLFLLPPRNILLVEVKSYRGVLSQASPTQWKQDKQDGSEPTLLKDPFLQISRAKRLLMTCLGRYAAKLNVVSCVVMTGNFRFLGSLRDTALVMDEAEFGALVRNYLAQVPQDQKSVSPEILAAACCLASDGIEPLFFDDDWFFGKDQPLVSATASSC